MADTNQRQRIARDKRKSQSQRNKGISIIHGESMWLPDQHETDEINYHGKLVIFMELSPNNIMFTLVMFLYL